MEIEDKYIINTKSTRGVIAKLSTGQQFLGRPGFDTTRKKILVYTKYFKVIVPKELTLTRYNIEVNPQAEGKKLACVFQLLLDALTDAFSRCSGQIPTPDAPARRSHCQMLPLPDAPARFFDQML